MNYEFTIRRLEAELAHVREVQAIHREHMEALVRRRCKLATAVSLISDDQTGLKLAAIEVTLETLAVDLKTLTGNVDRLVKALLREHPNGHGEEN